MEHITAGIDVSRKELHVAATNASRPTGTFDNTPAGHTKLIRWLTKGRKRRTIRVVVEPTGIYSLDLALALQEHDAIEVMVANPRQVHAFAKATGQRGKTDPMDAELLKRFGLAMEFQAFVAPSVSALQLRQIARRVDSLVREQTRTKNRLRAGDATTTTAALLQDDLHGALEALQARIARLREAAVELIGTDAMLARQFELLLSIKGVGEKSAISVLAELCVLPSDFDAKQLVAMAGLDPRPRQSGTSLRGRTPISKAGNRYLRGALYMPALVALRYVPEVRAWGDRMTARGKHGMQMVVAVMRKLLVAIYGMFQSNTPFDPGRFSGVPLTA